MRRDKVYLNANVTSNRDCSRVPSPKGGIQTQRIIMLHAIVLEHTMKTHKPKSVSHVCTRCKANEYRLNGSGRIYVDCHIIEHRVVALAMLGSITI